MIDHPRGTLAPLLLVACLLLGGASAAGYWANMFLQLAAIPVVAWSLFAERTTPLPRASRQLLLLLLLLLLLIGVQLVPLPPSIWTLLPGRGEALAGFELQGVTPPWLPISLTPYQTVASALWLLPTTAMVLAITRLGAFKPDLIAGAIIAVTLLGIALGAVQRAGNAAAYLYQITNYGVATGFFSNANHFATLLMVNFSFLAALYLVARNNSRSAQYSSGLMVILGGIFGVMVVGIAINGSLAGLGLSVPVLGASALMLLSRKRRIRAWWLLPIAAIGIAGIAIMFTAPMGNDLTSAPARGAAISRYTFFTNTLRAVPDFLPVGSGVGSFTSVYPMYEDPASVTTTYANHAHSDLLELMLETGLPGMLLLLVFLAWWARRAVAIWRAEDVDQFARAATVASAAILAHSLVDYPLRTAAIGAVFAACCALMAEPRPMVRPRDESNSGGARHLAA